MNVEPGQGISSGGIEIDCGVHECDLAAWIFTIARNLRVDALRRQHGGANRQLAEPARRNSGPALLSAALQFEQDGDPITAAIPSVAWNQHLRWPSKR